MKKILATSALLIVSIFSFALMAPTIKKQIHLPSKVTEAEIHGDVTIILTNDSSGSYYIEGHPGYLDKVKIENHKGKLIVENRNRSPFFKTIIYMPAADIKNLVVNGNGLVTSDGIIHTDHMVIVLNGLSVVNISSAKKRKIKVQAADDYELDFHNRSK